MAYEPGIVRMIALSCHNYELTTLFDEPCKINGNTANFKAAIGPVAFMQEYSSDDNAVHQQFTLHCESEKHTVNVFQTVYNKPYKKLIQIQIVPEATAVSEMSRYLQNIVPQQQQCTDLRAMAISIVRQIDKSLAVAKVTAPVVEQHADSFYSMASLRHTDDDDDEIVA